MPDTPDTPTPTPDVVTHAFSSDVALSEFHDETMIHQAELVRLASDIPALQAHLDALQAQEAAIEQGEQQRGKTCLSLKLEVTSCEYATEDFRDTSSSFPKITFPVHPCIFGKAQPDQDCRTCAHVKIIPWGIHTKLHERRYAHTGQVFPIQNEEQAGKIVEALKDAQVFPMRRVSAEIAATKRLLETAQEQHAAASKALIERQQGAR